MTMTDAEFLYLQRREQFEKERREEEARDQAMDDFHERKAKHFDNSFTDVQKIMGHRKYRDTDNDYANDYDEQAMGIHDSQNRHRPIRGLTTPGSAYTGRGGVILPYSHDIISLRLRPRTTNGGHNQPYSMPTPKKMQLTIEMHSPNGHQHHKHEVNDDFVQPHEFEMSIKNINMPHLYRMSEGKIKKVNVVPVLQKMKDSTRSGGSKLEVFSKNFGGIKKSVKKTGEKETDDLSKHLVNFARKQTKKSKSIGSSLDFSIVGIGKKKKDGWF